MLQRIALPVMLAAILALLPAATARAQAPPPPCHPFPLFWPVCIAGAVVYTAGAIVTAPFRAAAAPYPYYNQPYYGAPPYYGPGYYGPAYNPSAPR
jgi:hypothetical protein